MEDIVGGVCVVGFWVLRFVVLMVWVGCWVFRCSIEMFEVL
jgi:hypothetical protein